MPLENVAHTLDVNESCPQPWICSTVVDAIASVGNVGIVSNQVDLDWLAVLGTSRARNVPSQRLKIRHDLSNVRRTLVPAAPETDTISPIMVDQDRGPAAAIFPASSRTVTDDDCIPIRAFYPQVLKDLLKCCYRQWVQWLLQLRTA